KHFARLTIERMLNDRRFTQREREVIVLAFMGLTYAGIAERLFITEHTVKKRLESIRRKTGTGSFFELFMQHVPKEE
ncbi:MAG TPA: helix-turn-helix transcriptional regulator, partial [Candidatus Kapabacteria bacterium]|nr:helix-turn-helix transcriptional regulator [Candidatus Kapabacteria bacterium]